MKKIKKTREDALREIEKKSKCKHKNWEIKSHTSLGHAHCLDCNNSVSLYEIFGDSPIITSKMYNKLKEG